MYDIEIFLSSYMSGFDQMSKSLCQAWSRSYMTPELKYGLCQNDVTLSHCFILKCIEICMTSYFETYYLFNNH